MYLIRSIKGTYQTLGKFTADERRLLLKKNTPGAPFALWGDACATVNESMARNLGALRSSIGHNLSYLGYCRPR